MLMVIDTSCKEADRHAYFSLRFPAQHLWLDSISWTFMSFFSQTLLEPSHHWLPWRQGFGDTVLRESLLSDLRDTP